MANSLYLHPSPGSNSPAVQTEPQAHHYQLIGLEIALVDAQAVVSDLVVLGATGSARAPASDYPTDNFYPATLALSAGQRVVRLVVDDSRGRSTRARSTL